MSTPYAGPADLQQRYDWREIGDLLSDSNEQISALDQVTAGNAYNTLLVQLFADAAGDVEASLLAAGRYATTDLTALTGSSQALLKRILCELVIAYLYERKPFYKPERLEAYAKAKEGHLKRLWGGSNVFNLPLVVAAGLPEAAGPSTIDYQNNYSLVVDHVRGYPARRLPFQR